MPTHDDPVYLRNRRTLKRDARNRDTPCARCGQGIDWSAHWLNPFAFTAGHIVAMVYGGSHDLSNLQPEHRMCNLRDGSAIGNQRKRQATTTPPPRRFGAVTSRDW